jgi:hypothetical protein
MKKLCLILAVIGLFAISLGPLAEAQMQPPPAQPLQPVPPPVTGSPLAQSGKGYNPAAVMTLSGHVAAVNTRAPKKEGRDVMMTLVLKTEQGNVNVNVGPAAFVAQQNFPLAVGDLVQVKGSVTQRQRGAAIIAAEITKGSQVLRLRDEAGRPLWKGMMR